jgi:predicted nucleic acid-binding protein
MTSYLLDTGILLRAFDSASPEFINVRKSLRRLRESGESMVVTIQNVAEFWNVSTRPRINNGYGHSIERVRRRIAFIERNFPILSESAQSYSLWADLIADHRVTGVAVHDARLVAVMLAAGIPRMLTLNARDFQRFPGVAAVTPEALLAG